MKKKIISLVLVIALMSAMCLSASAASVQGQTDGDQPLRTSAVLNINPVGADASTGCSLGTAVLFTRITFTYRSTSNNTLTDNYSGAGSASAYPSNIASNGAIRAVSYHSVNTTDYGSWSYSFDISRQ